MATNPALRPFSAQIKSGYGNKMYNLTGNVPVDPSTIRMDATPWAPQMRETKDGTMMQWIDNPTTGEGFFVTPEKLQEGFDVNQYAPDPWWGKGFGAGVVPDYLKGIVPNDDWSRFNDYDAPWFKELQQNYNRIKDDQGTDYMGDTSFLGQLKDFVTDPAFLMGAAPIIGGLAFPSLFSGAGAAGGATSAGTSGLDFLAANPSITPSWLGGGAAGSALPSLDALAASAVGGSAASATPLLDAIASGTAGGVNLGSLPSATGTAATGGGVVNLANSAGPLTTQTATPAGAASAAPITTNTPGWKQWLAEKSGLSVGAIDALGTAATTLLGMYQANQSAGAASDLATQLQNYGAPSRARYEASFAPGFTMANEPGYADALAQTSDTLLRRLSAQGGNPFGNPGGLIEANKQINAGLALPALQQYRNQNASTGGYGAFNSMAPSAMANASGQDNSWMTVLGGGLNRLLNPPQQTDANSLTNVFAQLRAAGLV